MKVGDKIRILKESTCGAAVTVNQIVEVIEFDSDVFFCVRDKRGHAWLLAIELLGVEFEHACPITAAQDVYNNHVANSGTVKPIPQSQGIASTSINGIPTNPGDIWMATDFFKQPESTINPDYNKPKEEKSYIDLDFEDYECWQTFGRKV